MAKNENLRVTIISVERTLFDGEVQALFVPGERGSFEVLKNHAPIISSLSAGSIRCVGTTPFEVEISGGFIEVSDNRVNLCVES